MNPMPTKPAPVANETTDRRTRLSRVGLLSSLVGALAACGGGGGSDGPVFTPPPPPAPACVASPPPPAPAPGAEPPQVTLTLSNGAGVSGDVVLTLEPTRAPLTTANFLAYVNAGFYNCTVIHRHSPNFVLQGGGYAGPLVAGGTLPTLKPTNAPIALEDNAGLSNLALTVAMARTSTPDSATSQFFINVVNNTFLDRTASARGYAVFGNVSSGAAVVTAMRTAPCSAWAAFLPTGDCLPSPNITITRAVQSR
jgi:cyclophilin family peptidyl-prolyl cis-trans isomerase